MFEFITTEAFRSIGLKQLEENETALAAIEVVESVAIAPVQPTPATDKLEESIKLSIIEAEPEEDISNTELAVTPDKLEESIKLSIAEAEPEDDTITAIPAITATPLDKEAAIVEETPVEQNNTAPVEAAPAIQEEASPSIGSPLKFDVAETHSFAEWLQLSRFAPIQREEPLASSNKQPEETENLPAEKNRKEPEAIAQPTQLDRKLELIDRFIEINPKIKPVKTDTSAWENLGKTTADTPGLMTETLARVYLEQKKYTKAIQAYEILILKYPEKSVFFANRISEIKDLQ